MLRRQPQRAAFFAGSRRFQSLLVELSPRLTAAQGAFLAEELARHGLAAAEPSTAAPAARFCALVIEAHAALLRERGFYYPESAELLPPVSGEGKIGVAIPKIAGGTELAAELFQQLVRGCGQTAQGTPLEAWIGKLRHEVEKIEPPFLASNYMVRAAYELGMPILEWHSVFLQVGYGKTAAALTGAITQDTPSIGVHFAREKAKANALLARAGFPIADGGLVRDIEDARRTADRLGYPVVVKPANRDGGDAVSSDVRDPAELERAYAAARASSARVIVEKHIDGTDYRLLFFRGELLVALERTPGGVTGNGRDTVARLIERTNAERQGTPLMEIAFDDEARAMLARRSLTADSVPAKGRFVPLRRAANHALGGTIRRADDIHPDNVDLARRAMQLLRLDLAGLDLILPDATRSWREAGGVVCEVNAQPFIGEVVARDYYKEILQHLVPDGGRIPLVLVIGALDAAQVARLQRPGLAVVDAAGARRDGVPLSFEGASWAQACQAVFYDRGTTAALCMLDPTEPAPPYSPADRFSAAFVLDARPDGAEGLLRRADKLYGLPSIKHKGLKFETIQKAELPKLLAAALAGNATAKAARKAPAPRGKVPPALRKRR